jgi:hypothetical protein
MAGAFIKIQSPDSAVNRIQDQLIALLNPALRKVEAIEKATTAPVKLTGDVAPGVGAPFTTWKTGVTLAGFMRIEINGVARWLPYYTAPTGP